MSEQTNTLIIRTPEGISFSLLLAGPVLRCQAWFIDALVVLIIANVLQKLLGVFGLISVDVAQAVITLIYFVVSIGYGILLEWLWRGQTIGKRLFRLRVVDEHGLRLQFSQIAMRNLLRFVDSMPLFYLVGGISCVLTRHAQRLGDIAASTIVIRTPVMYAPDIAQIMAGRFNSFRNYPHLEARLRQRISAPEANLALQALLRRDQFDDDARIQLFGEMVAHFSKTVQFPPEVVEGMADEQYLRNVVDILFNTKAAR
ncbi:MAG TPA: RDD family protein [Planctomycetota bacterium]|nr:RDD family protein [Planctomycetota bacterium]